MSSTELREFQAEDKAWIVAALMDISALEMDRTSLQLKPDFNQHLEQWLSELATQDSSLLLVATRSGQPVGFLLGVVEPQNNSFTTHASHGVIQAIWSDPAQRQRGIGSSLLNEFETALAEHHIEYCDIAFHPQNSTAKKFWHTKGFLDAEIHARKFYR